MDLTELYKLIRRFGVSLDALHLPGGRAHLRVGIYRP